MEHFREPNAGRHATDSGELNLTSTPGKKQLSIVYWGGGGGTGSKS